jgi:hypothetical protein
LPSRMPQEVCPAVVNFRKRMMSSGLPPSPVMPALVAGIHVLATRQHSKDVDGRDKPGHDANDV